MANITVTKEEVAENMKDVLVRTEIEFGKPTTYVTVKMKNGFTIRESTTCVDPNNYDEEIGKKICLENWKIRYGSFSDMPFKKKYINLLTSKYGAESSRIA